MPNILWHGFKIRYEVHGQGPVVILVHGWSQSSRYWDELIPLLRSHYQVYSIDLPGFGGSDKPVRFSYALEDLTLVLVDFLEALHLSDVTFVGHSMGGVVSLLASLIAPDQVRALALINTPVQGPSAPLRAFRTVAFPELWFELGKNMPLAVRIAALVTVGRFDNHGAWAMQEVGRASSYAASRTYMRLSSMDLRGAARQVKVPTLIIGCENDLVVPPQAAHLLGSLIEGSQAVIMPNMRHMPMVEDPRSLSGLLKPFLRRVQGAAADPQRHSQAG